MKKRQPIGSLIRLKEGSEEPYLALHRFVFPTVLERIARSNIGNYSIFLHNNLLFSFYDYSGDNFEEDMNALAADPETRNWWQLTEPLQQPLPSRKKGEWWASMKHEQSILLNSSTPLFASRKAFLCHDPVPESMVEYLREKVERAELFNHDGAYFIYAEGLDEIPPGTGLVEMKEAFHTLGCLDVSRKKVFVTGCFDMLHSGHIAFLKEASAFGRLYVGIGSDLNVHSLKGRFPVNNESERRFMLEAVRHVHHCQINKGWGIMDFLEELDEIRPDVFVVNEDGHTLEKEELCRRHGIEYRVLKRLPHSGLPIRSTTAIRSECRIPFRIDLAGGWLDQPFVSRFHPGPVLTISIEPTLEFNDRSGMASSTRRKAIELWKTDIPSGDPEMLAKMLFSYDNPPGTKDVSGSQDALGIVLPGLNKIDYNGGYWPGKITSVDDESILQWIEHHLYLVTLGPRTGDYTVVENSRVDEKGAGKLAEAAEGCWNAIMAKDIIGFGKYFRESFEAQVAMFPNMAGGDILRAIEQYRKKALGWKLSGAGGGGYLILVSDQPVNGAFQIRIRRKNLL